MHLVISAKRYVYASQLHRAKRTLPLCASTAPEAKTKLRKLTFGTLWPGRKSTSVARSWSSGDWHNCDMKYFWVPNCLEVLLRLHEFPLWECPDISSVEVCLKQLGVEQLSNFFLMSSPYFQWKAWLEGEQTWQPGSKSQNEKLKWLLLTSSKQPNPQNSPSEWSRSGAPGPHVREHSKFLSRFSTVFLVAPEALCSAHHVGSPRVVLRNRRSRAPKPLQTPPGAQCFEDLMWAHSLGKNHLMLP